MGVNKMTNTRNVTYRWEIGHNIPRIIPLEHLVEDLTVFLKEGILIQDNNPLPSERGWFNRGPRIDIGIEHGSGYVGAQFRIPYGQIEPHYEEEHRQRERIFQTMRDICTQKGLEMKYVTHHIDDTGSVVGFYCLKRLK